MAARQHSTNVSHYHRPSRLTAPARILTTDELLALLDGRADAERTLDRAIARLDDIASDMDDDGLDDGFVLGGARG